MQLFTVEYVNEPKRNRSFMVRGICKCDVLNPCWDNRPTDVPGQHWGGGRALRTLHRGKPRLIAALATREGIASYVLNPRLPDYRH